MSAVLPAALNATTGTAHPKAFVNTSLGFLTVVAGISILAFLACGLVCCLRALCCGGPGGGSAEASVSVIDAELEAVEPGSGADEDFALAQVAKTPPRPDRRYAAATVFVLFGPDLEQSGFSAGLGAVSSTADLEVEPEPGTINARPVEIVTVQSK